MTVRERLELEEDQRLSPFALRASLSRGRETIEQPCNLRTDFQRDRDRIIHCKSFRRLQYKTQCFLPDVGDHFRTRLTHTLEVSQVARTLARALRLNEDLTEAIALGHDLGHTCFGHMGERTLDRVSPLGFSHSEQSVRVVEMLERDRAGLNLCWEVRDGIRNHGSKGKPATLEGALVSLSDRIAYLSHDIDDAIRAGVLCDNDIPDGIAKVLGNSHGKRIDTMIQDIYMQSADRASIAMSESVARAFVDLRAFMFEKVYKRREAQVEEEKADHILSGLYTYYKEHPEELLDKQTDADMEIAIRDFLSGMTDRYAVKRYQLLFGSDLL